MSFTINGIRIPDSKMARDATALVRDIESDLLFHHSSRVFTGALWQVSDWASKWMPSCFTLAACFMMGLTQQHCSCDKRFEVDGANAARDFLQHYGVAGGY